MAELIVISFDTPEDAEGAYNSIQQLNQDLIVELAGLAIVTQDDKGKTHVRTPGSGSMVGAGTAGGALFGTLIGILFFVPIAGLVLGGALGALFAGLDRSGISADFRQRARAAVADGRPTVVLYAVKFTEDKFAEAIAPYNGTLAQSSLSEADEKDLAHDLTGAN